jgi:ubiquinone/menaquinone biosynthesis C-methylase UbiE
MLKRAAERLARLSGARIALVQADAGRLPFAGGSVDRVLCFNSLHCLSPELQEAALKEFRRVLKPGCELVGTTLVADAAWPWQASVAAARLSGIFHPPPQARLAAAAARAGFTTWRQDLQGALVYFGGQ